jgi:hypothetical protein
MRAALLGVIATGSHGTLLFTSNGTWIIPDGVTLARAVVDGGAGGGGNIEDLNTGGGPADAGGNGGASFISYNGSPLITAFGGTGTTESAQSGADGAGGFDSAYTGLVTIITGGSPSIPGDMIGGPVSGGRGGEVSVTNLLAGAVGPGSVLTITVGSGGAGAAGGTAGEPGKVRIDW